MLVKYDVGRSFNNEDIMLTSLIIRNYRIFKEIKINKLSRVNLFVGKNNTGKSCLLEALQIYASKAEPQILSNIISSRDEKWNTKNDENIFQNSLGYLFNGYTLPLPSPEGEAITIGPIDDNSKQLIISCKAFQIIQDDEGRKIKKIPDPKKVNDELVDIQMALESTMNQKRCYYISLDMSQLANRPYTNTDKQNYNYQIVKTQHISDEKLSVLWDNINLTDLEKEIISCLQIIDSNISGVALVNDISASSKNPIKRIPIVRIEGVKERIPLKTMGDGLTRLFYIILALVNAKDGLLLIDEFENGLHWTVHPKIWNVIINLSKKLNVQVIATTHSRDCIKGYYDIWKSNEKYASFYRLETDPVNGTKTIAYTQDILSDAIDSGVEVR